MAKKSIGGIDEQVKERFDSAQERLGAGSANEALAALLEAFDGDALTAAADGYEAAGMEEVRRILAQAARQMALVLAHRHDAEEQALAEADGRAEALRARVGELEAEAARHAEEARRLTSDLEDALAKAAGVEALAQETREAREAAERRERAQAERAEAMMARLDRQLARLEAELADAKGRLGRAEAERDEARAEAARLRDALGGAGV